ncbi:MAG: hypothetical protein RL186_837 [Pseudomonadota bacterium]|jgi:predicted flap endonuclease-1-like 5' DNA nuclease
MSYILSQNIILVLVAALVGAGIAYFMGLCNCNSAELEAERNALLVERDGLNARLGSGAGGAALGAGLANAAADRKIASLEAELAQARARAEALASDVAKAQAAASVVSPESEPAATPAAAPSDLSGEDVTTMRWRNRYLEARVKYLEDQIGGVDNGDTTAPPEPKKASSKPSNKAGAKSAASDEPVVSPLAALSSDALEAAVLAPGIQPKAPPRSRKRANPDDLLAIDGVGPKNLTWLNEQGIYYFHQIASMNVENIAWLAENLPTFGSRVYRDNWVAQCANLMKGLPARG